MSRRYLLIKVCSTAAVTGEQFTQALTASILKYFGEVGLSRINPKLIRFDESKAIVAYAKDHAGEMQAALALICQIGDSEVSTLPLKASGTIKGLGKRS
jgi:RNase P/RNase MRP subunit POP5